MNKEFIPYEIALELKELGFDIPSISSEHGHVWENEILYQQAFRWFREKNITKITINKRGDYIEGQLTLLPLIFLNKYQIHVISPSVSYFSSDLTGKNKPFYAEPLYKFTDSATSYEEAELACLKKLIEIVKNK